MGRRWRLRGSGGNIPALLSSCPHHLGFRCRWQPPGAGCPASWTPRPSHPQLFSGQSFLSLWWLRILRSMLSVLLLLLAVLSPRTDRSACSSSSFSTSLMSLFALRSHGSCRGTWEDPGEQWGGHQPSSWGLGCWALGLGCWVLGLGCWVLGLGCCCGCLSAGRAPGTGQAVRVRHLQWWEVEGSGLGSSQLLCRGFALFLPCVVLLALLQGFSFRALVAGGCAAPPGWAPSSIPAAQLHVATEAPAKAHASDRRFPGGPGGLQVEWAVCGQGSWAASSTSPGSSARAGWQQRGLCGSSTWFRALLMKTGLAEHILWALL